MCCHDKKLKIAIVGFGGMGFLHFNNYKLIENADVIAICDKSEKCKARAKEYGLKTYDSLADLLLKEEVDLVDICTPTFTHYENVMLALKHKKNVICEKPIALTYDEAVQMVETAEKFRVGLFIGQVLQYYKPVRILKKIIEEKRFGKVLDCYFYRLASKPDWSAGSWMLDPSKSGLIPFDLHIHDLDLLISLFGEPKDKIYSSTSRKGGKYSEHYRFKYMYDGFEAVVEAAWYEVTYPFKTGFRIYFEDALLVFDEGILKAYTKDEEAIVFDISESILVESGINVPPTQMFYDELSDFINKVKSGYSGCYRKDDILKVVKILSEVETKSE